MMRSYVFLAAVICAFAWGCEDIAKGKNCNNSSVCGAGLRCCDGVCLGDCSDAEPAGPCSLVDETCNGEDDDCDGESDEGDPGGGVACVVDTAQGVCAHGTTTCLEGELLCDAPEPQEESCNGQDDDCDGEIDEGDPGGGMECTVDGNQGLCASGTTVCHEGELVCGGADPRGETCNGVDDDCDGETDEGDPGGGEECIVDGAQGICAAGTSVCREGELQCDGPDRQEETCNGQDDDCDGEIDEEDPGGEVACEIDGAQGVCASGTTVCREGELVCDGPDPQEETCNGLDDDCDGEADDDNPGGGVPCVVDGALGICESGTTVCREGALVCEGPEPQEEICNGQDDDCDGQADGGNPGGGFECIVDDAQGSCASGTTICREGELQCDGPTPQEETCNGLDDDCDGEVDEDETGPLTATCYDGPNETLGVGVCRPGTQTCAAGEWDDCADQVLPSNEICDGIDNDCDGRADGDLGQTTCGAGACSRTVDNCVGGEPQACRPGDAAPEICNGLDDDCDGEVDEDETGPLTATCYDGPNETLGVGVCRPGTQTCAAGEWGDCADQVLPSNEICDGEADEDCDGEVDEDLANVCGGCNPIPDPDRKGQPCDIRVDENECGVLTCRDDGTALDCVTSDRVAVCTDCDRRTCILIGIWSGVDREGIDREGTRWDESVWAR